MLYDETCALRRCGNLKRTWQWTEINVGTVDIGCVRHHSNTYVSKTFCFCKILVNINMKRQALWDIGTNKFCRMSAGWCLPGSAGLAYFSWHTAHSHCTANMTWSRQIKPHFYLHWNFFAPYRELKNLQMILDCGWAEEGSWNCQALM